MRILVINQFYAPDLSAGSQILTELCEDLVAAGDQVTVVASRGTYLGGELLPARDEIRGVKVLRTRATSFGKSSLVARMSDYLSFWASSIATAVCQQAPDVMLAVTTPPMIAAGAVVVARARGVPLVTWTQDVYPEVAVEFGLMQKGGLAARLFLELQRRTHRASSRIVAISAGMAQRLRAQGAPVARLRVVQNWCDGAAIRPRDASENAFRREHSLNGFVVMYSGNFGVAHDFAPLVGAARLLARSHPEVQFLFVGDGRRRVEAEALAAGLPNVRFLPYQPRENLGESLSAADAHLICLREGLDGLVVPSKLYSAIACGRPVFYCGPEACEVAQVIRTTDIGWTGPPHDSAGLARALERAIAAPDWRTGCGIRARTLFEEQYDRPLAVRRWRQVLEEATGRC